MDLREPTWYRIEPTVQIYWFAAAVLTLLVVGISSDPVQEPVAQIIFLVANLFIGWAIVASLLTHLCGGRSLLCEPPALHSNFHALTRFLVRVRLYNAAHRRPVLFFTAEIEIANEFETLSSPRKFLGQLLPRDMVEFTWAITARRRGLHHLRTINVRACFPGSLVCYRSEFTLDQQILALPAVYRLISKTHELLVGRRLAAGRYHFNPTSMEEFIGVRNYRPGDSPRNIHLVLSLRAPDYPNQLVVREYEDPTEDDISIVLDSVLTPEELRDSTCLYRHEKSLSFTAALCRFFVDRKYRVRFLGVNADGQTVELMFSRPAVDLPLLEAHLACWHPTVDRQKLWRLLEYQARRTNSAVLFVSLREMAEERAQPRLAVLSLTPDWQASLVEEVVSQ